MSKLFGFFNSIYSHNKPRQSYLALEEFWVTQRGLICLCTTVHIIMTVTNNFNFFVMMLIENTMTKLLG